MNKWLILIPFISAFIGWFTIWIAIKMLFHPITPKKIFGFTFHGIFPKHQKQFAEHLGRLVSKEFLSFKDIEDKITHPDNVKKVMPLIDEHIDGFLKTKLSAAIPMLSMFIGDKTIAQIKNVFMVELEQLFPIVMKNYMVTLQQELDLEKNIIKKVSLFSTEKLEQILNNTMAKELRFVGIIGGIFGFLLGLIQVLITFLQ